MWTQGIEIIINCLIKSVHSPFFYLDINVNPSSHVSRSSQFSIPVQSAIPGLSQSTRVSFYSPAY